MANHIANLTATVKAQSAAITAAESAVIDIRRYLTSAKFNDGSDLNGYVNVADVLARLAHVTDALNDR